MAARGSTKPKQPTILSVEDVLAKDDLPERTIEVPEWGGAVKVRAISKGVYTDIQKAATVDGQIDELKLELGLLVAGLVEPKFTPDQIGELQGKSVAAIDRIVAEVVEISGLSVRAVAAIEAAFRDAT